MRLATIKVLKGFLLGVILAIPVTFVILAVLAAFTPAKAQSVDTYIHPRALPILPLIQEEMELFAPTVNRPWNMAAIYDHETCISFKHSKCWNPHAQLKTSREQGLGLPQMTRTWNPNGTIRFDNIANMKKAYPEQLSELDWNTFKDRVDLQVRSSALLFNEEWKRLYMILNDDDRYRMTRSAWNGGGGRVATARSRCKLTTGCNPQIWFNHTEKHLPQSRVPMKNYGNRSPYDINTHYVRDTERRLNKFKPYFHD